MRTYNTIQEIKDHNKKIGYHWFDPDTMQFFNSTIESEVIKGRYFVTSEINPSDEKRYSARVVLNGSVETVGPFHHFPTEKKARQFIKALPEYFPHALQNARNTFNGRLDENETDFVTNAEIEIKNKQGIDKSTFTGACAWLINRYDFVDQSFIRHLKEKLEAI